MESKRIEIKLMKQDYMNKIEVLDKGYVRLIDKMGDDLSSINAARVSYAKHKDSFDEKDERLLTFLIKHSHMSPFRHAFLSFEVYAPLFVCRQWVKYEVGSNHGEHITGHNEASRRYITMEPEFYVPQPHEWRSAPANKKQGSGEPLGTKDGTHLTEILLGVHERGLSFYNHALELGVAPEQARGFLPAYFLYTSWIWSTSLQAVAFFLEQRLKDDAQFEIQQYAKAVLSLVKAHFPKTIEALLVS